MWIICGEGYPNSNVLLDLALTTTCTISGHEDAAVEVGAEVAPRPRHGREDPRCRAARDWGERLAPAGDAEEKMMKHLFFFLSRGSNRSSVIFFFQNFFERGEKKKG